MQVRVKIQVTGAGSEMSKTVDANEEISTRIDLPVPANGSADLPVAIDDAEKVKHLVIMVDRPVTMSANKGEGSVETEIESMIVLPGKSAIAVLGEGPVTGFSFLNEDTENEARVTGVIVCSSDEEED